MLEKKFEAMKNFKILKFGGDLDDLPWHLVLVENKKKQIQSSNFCKLITQLLDKFMMEIFSVRSFLFIVEFLKYSGTSFVIITL